MLFSISKISTRSCQSSFYKKVVYNKIVRSLDYLNRCKVFVIAQKMKFSIKDFFSKCDQIDSFLRIWSHLLKKSSTENFIFCAVCISLTKS